jgi:DNA-directed RNA polymerase subunit M/transcription elongation factor TFIIS
MTSATGTDIESVCTKCGTAWHVVVAKVGEKIAKVECKQCHSVHAHRAKTKAPKKAGGSSKKKAAVVAPAHVQADPNKPVRTYATTESFAPGERVDHSKFGQGVVQSSPGPGKIEILFGDQIKLLSQAKPSVRRFSS